MNIFDAKTITSEPPVDPTDIDWRQECRGKSMAEVLQSDDTVSMTFTTKLLMINKMLER